MGFKYETRIPVTCGMFNQERVYRNWLDLLVVTRMYMWINYQTILITQWKTRPRGMLLVYRG